MAAGMLAFTLLLGAVLQHEKQGQFPAVKAEQGQEAPYMHTTGPYQNHTSTEIYGSTSFGATSARTVRPRSADPLFRSTLLHAHANGELCSNLFNCFDGFLFGAVGHASINGCSALQPGLNGEFPVYQLQAFPHAGEAESLLGESYFRLKANTRVMHFQLDLV